MKQIMLFVIFFSLFITTGLFAQPEDPVVRGDAAVAARYVLWAEDAIAAGQWTRARAALERAADFADVSSDISYLLALARFRTNDNRGSVLQAVRQAIKTGLWSRYSETKARLLEAEQLIALRSYSAALDSVNSGVAAIMAAGAVDGDERAEFAMLRLTALKGRVFSAAVLPGTVGTTGAAAVAEEFRQGVLEAMELYPRDPRPLRIFFDYARNRKAAAVLSVAILPDEADLPVMDLAFRRLPFLLDRAPELAWMAAPFVNDVEEARRLVSAYRAGSYGNPPGTFKPNRASVIPALNLGLLDDIDAVAELFAPDAPGGLADAEFVIDKDLIVTAGDLLRSDEGRDCLVQALLTFTGVITEDEDRDGIPESRVVYKGGVLQEFYYDAEQGGLDNLIILFNSNSPQWAEISILPQAEPVTARPPFLLNVPQSPFLTSFLSQKAQVIWERYPAVLKVVTDGETFLFAPGGFPFVPVNFEEICATGGYAGLLFPKYNHRSPGMGLRMLTASAVSVQRPSAEFPGGVEQVFLRQGLPLRSEVTLNGRIVSVTEFVNGRPVTGRLDMDLDGRMETTREY